MDIRAFEIPDIKLILPKRLADSRGYFFEVWRDNLFRQEIADFTFVQDNQSRSAKRGTLRGLHFQKPPAAQGKLVRVLSGSAFDVTVDIRRGSPTYGRHVAITLNAVEGAQLWVPPGFLHGFCTLEDNTEVLYKVTSYYSPADDSGVLWNDPALKIEWPVPSDAVLLSDKDRRHPRLAELPDFFVYGAMETGGTVSVPSHFLHVKRPEMISRVDTTETGGCH
jgi:dTDP-4-dehydrorhamnose 3,5-epimerase